MLSEMFSFSVSLVVTATVLAVTTDPNLVLNILALASVLGVAYAIFRSGGFGVVQKANEELRRHNKEADDKIRDLTQQVGLLETKTSLEPMVAAVITQFEAHEARAQERHEAQLAVLSGFAANLERLARRP